MGKSRRLEIAFKRATGYLELAANTTPEHNERLRARAIEELQRVLDDDDYIDELYDEDLRSWSDQWS